MRNAEWHGTLRRDPGAVAGVKLEGAVVRRVLQFAGPHRWMLAGLLLTILADTIVTILPPLVFREVEPTGYAPRPLIGGRWTPVSSAAARGDPPGGQGGLGKAATHMVVAARANRRRR